VTRTAEEIADALRRATEPGTRHQLLAKGMARGLIWRAGALPEGAPAFGESLSADLLDHGYAILAQALELRDTGQYADLVETAFRVAAESIESAARKADPADPDRGFHIVVAAAAFHLAHLGARSYCLIPTDLTPLNLSSVERALALLMRRSMGDLRRTCLNWLRDPRNGDAAAARRLRDEEDFGLEEVLALAIARNFYRALALFDHALERGDAAAFGRAREMLVSGTAGAGDAHFVPLWWANVLARHLIDDLWSQSLHVRLPPLPDDGPDGAPWNALRRDLIASLAARPVAEVDLWPSQLDAAARAVDTADDLIVALPTSAGKTRVAELCILRTLAAGKRVVYVTPLRALSAQVERTLGRTFRPLGFSVSSLYGASGVAAADIGSLKASAIVVATPEKLDFAIRQQPEVIDDIGLVVLDEGHMIGLGSREVRYEVMVQRLLRRSDAAARRIVCLSAIFAPGEALGDFSAWLRSDHPGQAIQSKWRPTRQRPCVLTWTGAAARLDLFVDGEQPFVPKFVRAAPPAVPRRKNPFPQNDKELVLAAALALVADGQRVLVYCPQRTSVEGLAALCLQLHEQKHFPAVLKHDGARLDRARRVGAEWLGAEHVAVRALELGVGVHHGTLPRAFLSEVEHLLNERVLPIAIASPTLAQGLDLSCSALLFQSIYRAGEAIPAGEFANVVGRAGRAFVDLDGLTIYPSYDATKHRKRLKDYNRLRRAAESRSMESGILLLVAEVAARLAAELGTDAGQLIEYVVNHDSSWTRPPRAVAAGGAGEPGEPAVRDAEEAGRPLNELLDDLDTAILGTVDRLDCTATELADVLDAALRGSLWKRRLDRMDADGQRLQRAVLFGRAGWIWARTDAPRRQAFFAAGIGAEAGQFIHDRLRALLQPLRDAELAVSAGDAAAAANAACALAELLVRVHPFAGNGLPRRWRELVGAWLGAAPLGSVLGSDSSEEVQFVQDGIVYRLVWAAEAVRLHALAVGAIGPAELSGAVALVLTHGVSTVPAALLVEAGLGSRGMAMAVTRAYGGRFVDQAGLDQWLQATVDRVVREAFWRSPDQRAQWDHFVARWVNRARSAWVRTDDSVGVSWDPFYVPTAGEVVRVIDDPQNGVTDVCAADLSIIGVLRGRSAAVNSGHVDATVAPDLGHVRIQRWGPAAHSLGR
jgi:hypothetical protein